MSILDNNIDSKTSVPLFAVLLSAPILLGGILWLTAIHETVAEATRINLEQDAKLEKQMVLLQETHDAVIRIESRLTK